MSTNSLPAGDDNWVAVIEEMEATAADLREEGWEIVELHPGDVAVFGEDAEFSGFDVLVPDNEFDRLAEIAPSADLKQTEVYRAESGQFVYALVITLDADRTVGLCCPLYYDQQQLNQLPSGTDEQLATYIRTLSEDRGLVISHDDPSLFIPE